jgi:ureidoglycolate lyase
MHSVRAQPLTSEAFAPFGTFRDLIGATGPHLGAPPITFYRDLLPLEQGGKPPVFSICRVTPRDFVMEVMEYHSHTGEGILPLDGDVLVQVAPATPRAAAFPTAETQVFHVPMGTMLAIRPGVWHHAPFVIGDAAVNVVIVLPERTYANDTTYLPLEGDMKIHIER